MGRKLILFLFLAFSAENRPTVSTRQGLRDPARWEQLKRVTSIALASNGGDRLGMDQWEEIGDMLEPRRSVMACAERWRKGAPMGCRDHDGEEKNDLMGFGFGWR